MYKLCSRKKRKSQSPCVPSHMSIIMRTTRIVKEKDAWRPFKLVNQNSPTTTLTCSMWNVTSMVNKTPDIMEQLLDRDSAIVFLQETWLKSNRSNVTSLVKDFGYKLIHNIRKNREKEIGGGVGVLFKWGMNYKRVKSKEYSSFEHIIIRIPVSDRTSLLVISIYRVLFVPVTVFLEEFVSLLETLITMKDNVILAGDLNIHMEEDTLYAKKFKDILDTFNMVQHVETPTHKQGHTLDGIITFQNGPTISKIETNEYDLSHHFLVDFCVDVTVERKLEKEIRYRKLNDIDTEKLVEDITNSFAITDNSFGENITSYNEAMRRITDEHAPVITKTIKVVPNAPWFDSEYAELRKQRRRAEKLYKKTNLPDDKKKYIDLRRETTNLARVKKCKYYGDKLEGNNKILFSSVNKLLDNEKEVVLTDSESDKMLANSFLQYFTEKIEKIRSTFTPSDVKIEMLHSTAKLSVFEKTNEDEIRQIVSSFGMKCSPDDPIPSPVLKANIETFVPIWSKLVNLSLDQGSMECLKSSVVNPLIKQMDDAIDKDDRKNYRPVSNLQFIGKLIERVVSTRLNKHMTDSDLHSDFQHGYKKGHSTETLLLKVINDLLVAGDNLHPSIIMLLDMSAAFDTVDQTKLLQILKDEIGIEGTALKWFESFLIGRTQKVKIGEEYSEDGNLGFGVAQGSVLGPDLFNIYIRSLKKHVEPAQFALFGFADDHQLLKTFLPVFQLDALDGDINRCFSLISEWMNHFFLRLNSTKTKILVIIPPSLRNIIKIEGTFINNQCVRFVRSAKNLGVILDNELSFNEQITKVVQACFMMIRKLSKIKDYLTFEQLRTAVSALIFSRLDYCNALYYGIKAEFLNKLQYVQNSASRLVRKKNCFRGATSEYIRKCHWLPIRERIVFKVCLMVHKCLHGIAPTCLSGMLKYVWSSRTMKLVQYKSKGKFGSRAFVCVGPRVWNILPQEIRMEKDEVKFKAMLKTFLFDGFNDFSQKLIER